MENRSLAPVFDSQGTFFHSCMIGLPREEEQAPPGDLPAESAEFKVFTWLLHEHGLCLAAWELDYLMNLTNSKKDE